MVQQVKEEKEQEQEQLKKMVVTNGAEEGEEQEQLKKMVVTNGAEEGVEEEEMNGVENGEEGEVAVPMVNGKVDTESQAYKDAVLACSRENREACTMCSA